MAALLLRMMAASNRRDEEGRYLGVATRKEGRREIRNGLLVFLTLALAGAGMFYLVFVAPNQHAGLPVPWDMGCYWVLSPLLSGMMYLFAATLILVKMYRPDS
ncbi:MAG TPA: hypothetical protein VMU11_00475 [Verrucomicrobiae bacterium]|nr:hypothetical protein [Verrucomicrobiae bacterium]